MTEIAAASGRGDAAFAWVSFTEQEGVSFDALRSSNGFDSLDAKLLAALVRAAQNTVVGGQISRAQEVAARKGFFLKGRQALHLIYDYYKVSESQVGVMDLADLISVELRDDGHLQTFIDNWDTVLCGMTKEPAQEDMEVLLIRV
jgi:hypothetical protein